MPVIDGLEATKRIRALDRTDAEDRAYHRNDGEFVYSGI